MTLLKTLRATRRSHRPGWLGWSMDAANQLNFAADNLNQQTAYCLSSSSSRGWSSISAIIAQKKVRRGTRDAMNVLKKSQSKIIHEIIATEASFYRAMAIPIKIFHWSTHPCRCLLSKVLSHVGKRIFIELNAPEELFLGGLQRVVFQPKLAY